MLSDDSNENNSSHTSRRNFLKVLSGVFTGFIALSLSFPMIENLVGSVSKRKSKSYSKVTSVNSVPDNSPVNLSFVTMEEDAFIKNLEQHESMGDKKIRY